MTIARPAFETAVRRYRAARQARRDMTVVNDWNRKVVEEFRANEGRLGGPFEGAPVLLLHTWGRKSGTERVNPVMYLPQDGRTFVFASKAGAPEDPDWYLNLRANPQVTVELGAETFTATAVTVTGPERDTIYAEQALRNPGFAEYQEKTDRVIPVVELIRAG
jgi:deazaflavin-dependent oxidoreductase (nitroreductase family)